MEMSQQTRAALKVFGINLTNLEEAVQALENNPSQANLKNYLEAQSQLIQSLSEILNILSEIMRRGAAASNKTS